jgi:nondiscriminating glutamyl-tRNA synthetase
VTVRTRFAPSPTGHLHVGGARTAVLNWLLARHHGGALVLRVEDTDQERNVAGAEARILADLRWLGLDWDEGPDVGGVHGPYRQSERAELYRLHAERLLDQGSAYPCGCPPQAESPGEQRARCSCAERPAGRRPARGDSVRFRVPDALAEVAVDDAVRGRVTFPADSVEDFVLLRSDGRPTYNFAAAVDDHLMRITHVVRGADHLANTPKQQLLYRALGWPAPVFAHIPLILGPDRQKLSKRHGATSVGEHRRMGYLAEALVNYLSLLSWSSPTGEEFLPPERLVEEVELARVGASDAVFDRDKLRWLSGRYIQALPLADLVERLAPFVEPDRLGLDPERLPLAAELLRERIDLLSEAERELARFLGPGTPAQRAARVEVLSDAAATAVLEAVRARLAGVERWEEAEINAAIREGGREAGARGRALFHPVRAALTGESQGPELAKVALLMGRARSLELLGGAPAAD